jgi:hypothetical protein
LVQVLQSERDFYRYADIGWSNSLGWYEGFCLLTATEIPRGSSQAFCFGAASTADQQLAETFFAVRAQPNPSLASVGSICWGPYIADKGFEDAENHRRWQESYGAQLIHPPKRNSRKRSWSKLEAVGGRNTPEIVETVYDKLFNTFGLWGSELMSFRVCELAWRRGWRCTTSASGSTINSVVPDWPSPTCWDGDLRTHTKRSNIGKFRDPFSAMPAGSTFHELR